MIGHVLPCSARDDSIAARSAATHASVLTARLRIIETTDLHMQLRGYDYLADRPAPGTGLAAAATMIRTLRDEVEAALLLDAGDFLQGTPLGDEAARSNPAAQHPAIAAMAALGYDAVTLGNHEFNYGLDTLRAALKDAPFPVVCANVARRLGADPADDDTLVPPYVLLDRMLSGPFGEPMPIRIGVIGFAPPQIAQWDREHLHGRISTRDIVATARARVPELRAAGANLVIALAHTGIGPAEESAGMENAALPLAAVDGIDLLAIGHTHHTFPSPQTMAHPGVDPVRGRIHGKPAVMAGAFGSHIGVIDLTLVHDGRRWRLVRDRVRTLPVPRETRPAQDVLSATEPTHRRTLARLRRPLGRSAAPVQSYFAMVGDLSALHPMAEAKRHWAKAALAEAGAAHLPLLAAVAPIKGGGPAGPRNYTDIAAGPVAQRHIADLYGFPNRAQVLRVTGAALRDWLETVTCAFAAIRPGAVDAPLLNGHVPSYHVDLLDGLSYTVDLTKPPKDPAHGEAGGRIRDLSHDGRPVAGTDAFAVVTTSYRAGGGGAIAAAAEAPVIATSPLTLPDLLARHLRRQGWSAPGPDPGWRFAPIPDATAIYETGPGARAHGEAASRLGLTLIGPGESGFDRYRLDLS